MVNAFCTECTAEAYAQTDKIVYCGMSAVSDKRVFAIKPFEIGQPNPDNIYIPSMCDETLLESACDHILTSGVRAVVRAAYELTESGIIEARYKLSPIMLLHKLGVLGNCTIVGGVCLDNDDLDLMAQESIPLVLTPTASAGYGHGFAPVCAAVRRGIKIGVGTFDGKYNINHSVDYELQFLRLTANAEMSIENALSEEQLKRIAAFE